MMYRVHPKIYRLQHEIHSLMRHMANAQRRLGISNPAILNSYREMIRARQDLVKLLQRQQQIPTLDLDEVT
ncbi:MAG: hypothetical protein V7785_15885 [Bermanella sp.]